MGRPETYAGHWWQNLEDTHHLEYLGTDGKIILRWIFKKLRDGTALIHQAQQGEKWWTLANTVLELWVPQNKGNFLIG